MKRVFYFFLSVFVSLISLPLPGVWRGYIYKLLRGYQVEPGVRIGICFINCRHVKLATGSRIGHMTCIRNLTSLEVRENSRIGSFNWIFGGSFPGEEGPLNTEIQSELTLDPESSVTSRHIIDCTASVQIGAYSTLAGYRSQILTHGIDITKGRQNSMPVSIGQYCMIGSGCLILKGSLIPDGSVLAAGSTFYGRPARGYGLFSGVPARRVKDLDPSSEYFQRTSGPVL